MGLLQKHREQPAVLQKMLAILWADMDKGGFSAALAQDVLRFNGKLFKGAGADGYSLLLTPEQIDLLIEAARAKEEGKGFGVVALEIKRLAEEVFESTEDIKEVIQDIQRVSHALVLATEDEMKTVARGTDLAQQAGVALQQIFDMVRLTTESAQRIAAAMQQQQETSEHAFQSVEVVNQSFAKFSQEAKQFAVTTAELTFLAEGLGKIISGFDMAAQQESRT